MNLKEKLDVMVGKAFLVDKEQIRVVSWAFHSDDCIQIVTDAKAFEFTMTNIHDGLSAFLPVEESEAVTHAAASGYQLVLSGNGAKNLKDILMDNIKKVQENKDYIPQAQEVGRNVNSIIDLAKAEIDFLKTVNGKRG